MRDSTTAVSDLPRDLVEEVISRVPLTSLRAVQATCKKWNRLCKKRIIRKHIRKSRRATTKKRELMAIMMMDSSVYLMSVNLHGIHNDDNNNVESSIERKGKLISLNDAQGVDVLSVFHCSGLLLCLTKEKTPRLVVWNPYLGQTRWIDTTYERDNDKPLNYSFSLGYEEEKNSHRSLKILRSIERILRFIDYGYTEGSRSFEFEIYNFNCDSWKDITLTANGHGMRFYNSGVSLKGNTYWLARNHTNSFRQRGCGCCAARRKRLGGVATELPELLFLLCFDFTRERFGPRLALPFQSSSYKDTVNLSTVREEQLAVLLIQRNDTRLQIEIWITTKIEPEAASWSKLFLAVDMKTLFTYDGFPFDDNERFLVDEEKKLVMVFAKDTQMHNLAYIIGDDGYSKKVDLGETIDKRGFPLLCSYVPSSMQIKQAAS